MTHTKSRVALFGAALLIAAGSAGAATVSECIAAVGVAKADIAAATTFEHERDRAGLQGKADSAILKLDQAKFGDAQENLSSMSTKVGELVNAAKPKLGADDGAVISADVAAAQACVTQLQTQ